MNTITKKYTLKDLKLGMKINSREELDEIYDTWILMTRTANNEQYTIEFIGKETNSESDKLFKQGKQICPVYNDSMELEGDVSWDE